VLIETLALRESIASGALTSESTVLAPHHTLDKTPMITADGDVNLQGNLRTELFTTHCCPVADTRGWSRSQPNCAIVLSCTSSGRVNWPMTLTATWLRSIAGSPS
jgi:hypothetical protein